MNAQSSNKLAKIHYAGEQGQSLTEFAVTLPILIILLVGILDLGRVVYINTMLSSAAQAGARAGLISTNPGTIEAAVQSKLSGVTTNLVVITVNRTDDFSEVTVRYTFTPVTPLIAQLLPNDGITLQQTSRMQVLGVVVP